MIGARVIAATPGTGTRSVLIDRGSQSGVRRGMAVVTPDGIVGTVIAAFPFASQVRSVTDPGFAAGVESQKNHVHGVLKGLGTSSTRVDYVATGQKVENGEMFFTDGEDRIFPKGLPVGRVTSVREGASFQEITVQPSGTESAPEEVLVIVDPVHQGIPDAPPADSPVFLAPDVNPGDQSKPTGGNGLTAADKLRDEYKKIGDAQKHTFGVGEPGTLPPNFNLKVPGVNAPGVYSPAPDAPDKKADAGAKPPGSTQAAQPAVPPVTKSPAAPDKKAEPGAKPPASIPSTQPTAPPATRSPAPPVKEPQP
jgi:rod shape-determining protein MreC